MFRLIIYCVLLILLMRALMRLWRGFVEGVSGQPPGTSVPRRGVEMARDPVCGTFVVPERAIVLATKRDQLYFCSTGCRDKYQAQRAHPA
jgi:YHS domain-containing protein